MTHPTPTHPDPDTIMRRAILDAVAAKNADPARMITPSEDVDRVIVQWSRGQATNMDVWHAARSVLGEAVANNLHRILRPL